MVFYEGAYFLLTSIFNNIFIFVYIYYYRSYTYLINYRKGDLKRQLHSMDLTLIIKTVKVETIKKDLLPKEVGLHFIGKS